MLRVWGLIYPFIYFTKNKQAPALLLVFHYLPPTTSTVLLSTRSLPPTMNTPNRNTVVKMILEQIGDMEFEHQYQTHLEELGQEYFNGGVEDYDDLAFWENMKEFKERVWDKHVSAQFDFMKLWHDELDTDIFTINWVYGVSKVKHVPYDLPIIVSFMMQEANAFGQRLMEVHENEASLIKIQALVRGRNTRWRIPCFGFDNKIADYDSISLFPSKVYHD